MRTDRKWSKFELRYGFGGRMVDGGALSNQKLEIFK